MARAPLPAAVLFDLDGTLIHSAPDLHASANVVANTVGAEPFDLATVTSFIGNGVPVLIERILDARGLDHRHFDGALAVFLEHYEAHATDLTRPFEGVPALLDSLRGAGLQLAIVTNKPEAPAAKILADLGLAHLFESIVGGDSTAKKKPDPAPYRLACQRLGVRPGETVYVGDSETDAATANAGVPFALFLGGYRKQSPEAFETPYRFSRFGELPGLMRHLWKVEGASAAHGPAGAAQFDPTI